MNVLKMLFGGRETRKALLDKDAPLADPRLKALNERHAVAENRLLTLVNDVLDENAKLREIAQDRNIPTY